MCLRSGICCQFDFVRANSAHPYKGCPWGVAPRLITPSNVAERAATLLDQYRKKSTLYRTRHLVVPLGNDFEFMQTAFATSQFSNYQQLFDYMNTQPHLNVHARFATLHEFFRDTRKHVKTHPAKNPNTEAVPGEQAINSRCCVGTLPWLVWWCDDTLCWIVRHSCEGQFFHVF
eukprot:COSAG01_NODE_1957_length_8805_cov_22.976344_8_plen_174_part_00